MKFIDAYVVWLPNTDQVHVVDKAGLRMIDKRKSPAFYWIGLTRGDFGDKLEKTQTECELMMFITFHTLVVRDKVPVEAVHRAFLVVDEYRRRISPDTPGAEN